MRANIWIRIENEDKWKAIPDKSNWVNTLLANSDDTSRYGKVEKSPVGPTVPVLTETLPEKFVPRPPDPDTGYPCCEKKRPCKHWHFNGDKGVWINELTGKEREPE